MRPFVDSPAIAKRIAEEEKVSEAEVRLAVKSQSKCLYECFRWRYSMRLPYIGVFFERPELDVNELVRSSIRRFHRQLENGEKPYAIWTPHVPRELRPIYEELKKRRKEAARCANSPNGTE